MKNWNLLFVVMIFVLLSCKKQEDGPKPDHAIKIGDYNDMFINKLNTTKQLAFNFAPFSFDVDNDGIDDFSISEGHSQVPGNFSIPSALITCLDTKTFFSMVNTFDSTWLSSSTHTTGNVISTSEHYYCHSVPNVPLYRIDSAKHLKRYALGDSVTSGDLWQSRQFGFLNLGNEPFATYYDWVVGGTVHIVYTTYYFNCYFLPREKDVFIGIKKVNGEHTKYGWIKLYIADNNTVTIVESAMQ